MRFLSVSILTCIIFGFTCAQRDSQLMNQGELDSIRDELAARACMTRIDSLSFEIDGILYHAAASGDDRPLSELLPDSLPACPSTGAAYIIAENHFEVTITCPIGHGSVTLEK